MASSKTKVVGSNPAEPISLQRKMCVKTLSSSQEKTKNPWRKKSLLLLGNGPHHLPSWCQCRTVLRGNLLALVNGYPFTRVAEWSSLHTQRWKPDDNRGVLRCLEHIIVFRARVCWTQAVLVAWMRKIFFCAACDVGNINVNLLDISSPIYLYFVGWQTLIRK